MTPHFFTPNDLCFLQTRVAWPAHEPRYVIPGSHLYDPFWGHQVPPFPFPRAPWPFESETRAAGTGLLTSFIGRPCTPGTSLQSSLQAAAQAQPFQRPPWAQQALARGR